MDDGDLVPGFASTDVDTIQGRLYNVGYKDGVDIGYELKLQQGFEDGYRVGSSGGWEIGMAVGRLAGLRWKDRPRSNSSIEATVSIACVLDTLQWTSPFPSWATDSTIGPTSQARVASSGPSDSDTDPSCTYGCDYGCLGGDMCRGKTVHSFQQALSLLASVKDKYPSLQESSSAAPQWPPTVRGEIDGE